jgi:hydrogenase expression/formation protein HypC
MCLAVPGRVCALDEERGLRMATVDFDGVRVRVCVETLTEVEAGSWVLVHAGIALQTLDEAAARRALETLGGVDDGADPA